MAEYNKVIFILAVVLVYWFSGTLSVCRKRCRANNPKNKGCGDNSECRNDSAVPPVERCFQLELPCFVDSPENYRGNVNYTESGKECLRWESIDELYSTFDIYEHFDYYDYESYEEASNFCRYPYGNYFDRPWCITEGGIDEACNIIKCAQ